MYARQYAAKNEDKKTPIFIFKVQCGSFLFFQKTDLIPSEKYVQSSRFVATNRIFMIQVKSSRRGEARIIGSICEDVLYSI